MTKNRAKKIKNRKKLFIQVGSKIFWSYTKKFEKTQKFHHHPIQQIFLNPTKIQKVTKIEKIHYFYNFSNYETHQG